MQIRIKLYGYYYILGKIAKKDTKRLENSVNEKDELIQNLL